MQGDDKLAVLLHQESATDSWTSVFAQHNTWLMLHAQQNHRGVDADASGKDI